MYYGRKGEPLTLLQYAGLMKDMSYLRIALDELPATTICAASFVSTVWLGINHSFLLKGPPVIFETMRFELRESTYKWLDGTNRTTHASIDFPDPEDPDTRTEQMRYCTEEQASLGHRLIVRLIQEREMQ